jgi:hypothetical protein
MQSGGTKSPEKNQGRTWDVENVRREDRALFNSSHIINPERRPTYTFFFFFFFSPTESLYKPLRMCEEGTVMTERRR